MRTQSQYVISQPLRCWLLSLVLLSGCCLASLAQDMVTDYLHVGKTLKFQGKKFELKWCQHQNEALYLQEWLPEGETFDNYEQMLTVTLLFSEAGTVQYVEYMIQTLEERKKTDCAYYYVHEKDGEYVIDFLVLDGAGGKVNFAEVNINHCKPVIVNGKKAIQVNLYTRRAYGDDINPFLESIDEKTDDWINELTQMNIVCKMK